MLVAFSFSVRLCAAPSSEKWEEQSGWLICIPAVNSLCEGEKTESSKLLPTHYNDFSVEPQSEPFLYHTEYHSSTVFLQSNMQI